jgi:hypothetical protein
MAATFDSKNTGFVRSSRLRLIAPPSTTPGRATNGLMESIIIDLAEQLVLDSLACDHRARGRFGPPVLSQTFVLAASSEYQD